MKYALLDDDRKIVNIIEIDQDIASGFNAHYLGNAQLGIGDQYPDNDFQSDSIPAEAQRNIQSLTAKIDYIAMISDVDLEGM